MTEHLPECADKNVMPHYLDCFCDVLRLCESRATAGAVQRIEALWSFDPSWDGTNWNNALTSALAAIKGDQQ